MSLRIRFIINPDLAKAIAVSNRRTYNRVRIRSCEKIAAALGVDVDMDAWASCVKYDLSVTRNLAKLRGKDQWEIVLPDELKAPYEALPKERRQAIRSYALEVVKEEMKA
jgi:hypothetical protein